MLHIIFILVFGQAVVIYTEQMLEQTFVNYRVSNQNLEMERGRHQAHTKPREERLCKQQKREDCNRNISQHEKGHEQGFLKQGGGGENKS